MSHCHKTNIDFLKQCKKDNKMNNNGKEWIFYCQNQTISMSMLYMSNKYVKLTLEELTHVIVKYM